MRRIQMVDSDWSSEEELTLVVGHALLQPLADRMWLYIAQYMGRSKESVEAHWHIFNTNRVRDRNRDNYGKAKGFLHLYCQALLKCKTRPEALQAALQVYQSAHPFEIHRLDVAFCAAAKHYQAINAKAHYRSAQTHSSGGDSIDAHAHRVGHPPEPTSFAESIHPLIKTEVDAPEPAALPAASQVQQQPCQRFVMQTCEPDKNGPVPVDTPVLDLSRPTPSPASSTPELHLPAITTSINFGNAPETADAPPEPPGTVVFSLPCHASSTKAVLQTAPVQDMVQPAIMQTMMQPMAMQTVMQPTSVQAVMQPGTMQAVMQTAPMQVLYQTPAGLQLGWCSVPSGMTLQQPTAYTPAPMQAVMQASTAVWPGQMYPSVTPTYMTAMTASGMTAPVMVAPSGVSSYMVIG